MLILWKLNQLAKHVDMIHKKLLGLVDALFNEVVDKYNRG